MNEKIIQVNGVDICTESFGNPTNPAVLLIMGATASMIWWDEVFCQKLADNGRFVIRYDSRDVGRSVVYEPGNPQYSIDDMVDDAAGVLDAYGIDQAYIMGMSLGGMIAQLLALKYPQKVRTLTLVASSVFSPENPDLPPIGEKILAYHAKAGSVNWGDVQTATAFMAEGWGLLTGSKRAADKERAYQLAEQEVKRANNLLSMFNHSLLKGGDSYFGRIKEINVPTLVIHGTEDPVLPYEHGLALVKEIPHAQLLTLEGAGHEVHSDDWDTIIHSILKHSHVV